MSEESIPPKGGLPESLRTAVERTLSMIGSRSPLGGGSAATRERAQELLDEVARRGQEAREQVERRMRAVSGEEIGGLASRVESLERRISELEAAVRGSGTTDDAAGHQDKSQRKVEG